MTSPDDGQEPAPAPRPRCRPLGRVGRWAGRHGCSERGAVLVEAAFVFPVLIMLILGVIDFGFAFNDYISLRQGVRETARETAISTIPQPASGSWACPLAGGNNLGNTAIAPGVDYYDIVCYAKAHIGLSSAANTRVSIWWDTSQQFAPRTNPTDPDAVIICAQYTLNSITGLFGPVLNNKVITAKTEIRIEQLSKDLSNAVPTPTVPIAEPSMSGAGWPATCQTA